MSRDYRKILGESSNVMMSDSLKKSIGSTSPSPVLRVLQDSEEILKVQHVYSFQKSAAGIKVICNIRGGQELVSILAGLSFYNALTLNYYGTLFEDYFCCQWETTTGELNLPGENRLELIFEKCSKQPVEQILND